MHIEKIKNLQKFLESDGADYLLLTSLSHEINDSVLTYVLGYEPEHVALLIPKSGEAILWLTPFEVPEATTRFSGVSVRALDQNVKNLLTRIIKLSETVLIRENVFPAALVKSLSEIFTLKPATGLEKVVAIKTKAEIMAMREVAAVTDKLFTSLVINWPKFKTEADAARQVYQFALEHNCTVSFPPIIASAANAAEPHHQTNDTPLLPGFCVLDIGLKINGYCSDLSRTIFIGQPSVEEQNLYETVKNSQQQAIEAVKPGVLAGELDKICRTVLGEDSEFFIHGLGHGVGTAVHEWPGISSQSQAVLAENMIVTIEPGVYYPGKLGIRIEDDILVTKNGAEVLNQAPKNLICV